MEKKPKIDSRRVSLHGSEQQWLVAVVRKAAELAEQELNPVDIHTVLENEFPAHEIPERGSMTHWIKEILPRLLELEMMP